MHKPPQILVVDDDLFVRRPLESILRQEGFDAVSVVDGESCLAQLSADVPDLILLDVMLPGVDGFDLCESIKGEARYAAIPIILLSGRAREADRTRGRGLGAADFIEKPYVAADLVGRVRDVLSQARG